MLTALSLGAAGSGAGFLPAGRLLGGMGGVGLALARGRAAPGGGRECRAGAGGGGGGWAAGVRASALR